MASLLQSPLPCHRSDDIAVPNTAALQAPLALVSSAPEARVMPALETAGLVPRFDAIVTADDVYRGKPDPEGYLYAAQVGFTCCWAVLRPGVAGCVSGRRSCTGAEQRMSASDWYLPALASSLHCPAVAWQPRSLACGAVQLPLCRCAHKLLHPFRLLCARRRSSGRRCAAW